MSWPIKIKSLDSLKQILIARVSFDLVKAIQFWKVPVDESPWATCLGFMRGSPGLISKILELLFTNRELLTNPISGTGGISNPQIGHIKRPP